MKISVGDKVRFLNEIGGGTVSRVEEGKLIYVLDDDGFEVPTLINEVVVVGKKVEEESDDSAVSLDASAQNTYQFEESDEAGEPKLLLAFARDEDLSGNVKLYLINDSNYFVFYTIGRMDKSVVNNAYHGLIEPNTKIHLDTLAINFVDGIEYVCQFLLYRQSKPYDLQQPVSHSFKLAGAKLLKESSYQSNDYLEDKALIIYLIKGVFEKKLEELSHAEINKALIQKEQQPNTLKQRKKDNKEMLEVDLHIHALLDDTRGMSNKEILEYQLAKFNEIMEANKNNKNKKIVFIHGKGNGVLKSEIIKTLKKKYTWHNYQDASFKEYGFGATMVII
ncbi:Smr domain-containing protein [Saccharicrinis carchari]|uniref:Smr domain-containing protein n=1 Tax=Saccharicrinis carchari TaxID=1168039 RepID=A0A521BDZ9_SACCC|nr:DUF2027 domain-containing protein [Saccharicrinis carchari]SMO45191.1 Smr domain-containing protein [Saccharicrinis carchari]